MPYAKISRHEMIQMLDFAQVDFDTLIAHRDHTFTLRARFTVDQDRVRNASVGRLCKTTHAILLDERTVQVADRQYIQIRFAFED